MAKITIEGIEFEIHLIEGTSGLGESPFDARIFRGVAGDKIFIDSRLGPQRRDEVLLHELIHAVGSDLEESQIKALAERLFGVLNGNNLWRSPDLASSKKPNRQLDFLNEGGGRPPGTEDLDLDVMSHGPHPRAGII